MGEQIGASPIPKVGSDRLGVPEKMSDETLGNLLATIGNHEAKAVTLIAMRPGVIYSRGDLHKTVANMQGSYSGWLPLHHEMPWRYCLNDFEPIGLVAEETFGPHGLIGYMKTDYGDKIGTALASLLLDFSLRHPKISLYDLFGQTSSTSRQKQVEQESADDKTIFFKKRSPLTRLRIFRQLVNSSSPLKQIDIATALGTEETFVSTHINELSRRGILSSEGVGREPFVRYRLVPNAPDMIDRFHKNRKIVYAILKEAAGYISFEDLKNRFIEKLKEANTSVPKYIDKRIGGLISYFVKLNLIEFEKFHDTERSKNWLTSDQRAAIFELINILDKFQSYDPETLKKGEERASFFLSHADETAILMKKAHDSSPGVNKKLVPERKALIISLIQQLNLPTTSDLFSAMKKQFEHAGGKKALRQYLHELETQGVIVSAPSKKGKKWMMKVQPSTIA